MNFPKAPPEFARLASSQCQDDDNIILRIKGTFMEVGMLISWPVR